ncbi:hypothetical protein JCGZ_18328 [Jatropha curcas]|uniref:Uncharacterized protein n=1 Tax=Jatropha curcas TaxID=180498 RepID=A0A067JZV1_JATCU|nr:CLAVATA3/ESR (CLE)-related protein 27 [Jatropha curcas]KDP29407.1 hypothetical protein JCGZ_18328 [Jatropha curcas]
MSFASLRRIVCSSSLVVVVLVIFVLQIWVFSDCNCKAGAIRIFPDDNGIMSTSKERNITSNSYKASKDDLFHKFKFFNGRQPSSSSSFSRTEKGFEENKRRVPSCPDPLHN